jgi:hypothetical protein
LNQNSDVIGFAARLRVVSQQRRTFIIAGRTRRSTFSTAVDATVDGERVDLA